jgi:hypothetical protein
MLPVQTGKPHSSASSFEANLLAEDDRHSPDSETPAAQDRTQTPVNNEPKASRAKTHANTSAPATTTNSDRPAKQEPAASQRTQSVWGAYSIVRRTQVFSEASDSSAFVATIDAGTEVNVVSARNGWYEIRSKTGRPPGFIRQEHARRLR